MSQIALQYSSDTLDNYSQISVRHDPQQRALWYQMAPSPNPCFNPVLLGDLKRLKDLIRQSTLDHHVDPKWAGLRYIVGMSDNPNVFSMGGDLSLFAAAIQKRDAGMLRHYARLCIELVHANNTDLDRNLTTISLVRGSALGGGMEMALSGTVVIAERNTEMGLPESLFGLFPGMGAYQIISRRAGSRVAEEIIQSGKIYKAEELHDRGLIDVLVDVGEGENAVRDYMHRQDNAFRSQRAIHEMRRMQSPIRYDDLEKIVEMWIDAAMHLSDRQLRIMQRLARSQIQMLSRQQRNLSPVNPNAGWQEPEPRVASLAG